MTRGRHIRGSQLRQANAGVHAPCQWALCNGAKIAETKTATRYRELDFNFGLEMALSPVYSPSMKLINIVAAISFLCLVPLSRAGLDFEKTELSITADPALDKLPVIFKFKTRKANI